MNTKKVNKLLNMFKGHHQMLFSGLFYSYPRWKNAPRGPSLLNFPPCYDPLSCALSKVTKNRQQIAPKEVRIIVDFHNVLKIISIPPLNHDPTNVMLKLFKVFPLPNRLTRLTVLSVGVFPFVISLPIIKEAARSASE